MPYVQRDGGRIVGVFAKRQEGYAEEFLPDDNADVVGFLNPIPMEVSRAQAKIALLRANLLGSVETAVSAAGGEVAIWYADALNWRRDNPNIIGLGASLDLSPAQIDALFVQAAAIEA